MIITEENNKNKGSQLTVQNDFVKDCFREKVFSNFLIESFFVNLT